MKLKLTTKPQAAADGAPAASPVNGASEPIPTPTSTSTSAPKLKFKLSTAATPAQAPPTTAVDSQPTEAPKQKRKYTKKPKVDANGEVILAAPKIAKSKKRPREENGEEGSPVAKRKPKPTAKSLERVQSDDDIDDELHTLPNNSRPAIQPMPPQPVRTGSKIKIKMKGNQPTPQRSNTTLIKIKGVHGKPPYRPPGVGYDSEAEEAEDDPAIESQFILRMQPGSDCDLLRQAIEEKTIGTRATDGKQPGPSVQFRFFDQHGRRALVSIQGRLYAACMVDLPCVVESMKSWSKKDWVKTADICQMLLVLGRVQNEEEAKKYPLPREVNPSSHQYAHGLTPPMHHVRKRRFRPRVSYHRIEQVEAEVNALLEADRKSSEGGGRAEFQIIDADKADSSEESSDEDAEGEDDEMVDAPEYIQIEDSALAEMLQAGLMDGGDDDLAGLFGNEEVDRGELEVEVETPATAHDVAMHALGGHTMPTVETAASSPNAATSPDDDDDDDDEDADSPEDAEDAEAAAELAGRETQLAEVRELEQEIEDAQTQYSTINNILYKQRLKLKMERLRTDLDLKKKALGIDDGD
ncbi:transcription initiation factor TFIID subunit 7 [Dendryphion nanum]|uniref:Transcription initiation factor TFIID subunit 7 n=1 Tax=Dendryphion nanum TaxID=256645 RepID=A0A9P9DT04_9PLEO|nr:transcription initiation factor TFIID subunit 7 [Dendryphion nanum]